MKILKWIKDNINIISLFVGVGLVLTGHEDVGKTVLTSGASL